MPIPVCNGDKVCGGIVIGNETEDVSSITEDTIILSPQSVPYKDDNIIVIIKDI